MTYEWKLDIGMFAGGTLAFCGETPRERDLGGAEYCTVMLAEALARLGHRVVVFTAHSPDVYKGRTHVDYQGVTYYPREQSFKAVCWAAQWDVFIVSRDYSVLTSNVIQAKLLLLWNHDILSDPDSFREHMYRADKIYCLSRYQRGQYVRALRDDSGQHALSERHITLTRNGVDAPLIYATLNAAPEKYLQPTFIYTSRPERGLLYLLRDLWPRVRRVLPEAQLLVACYDTEDLPAPIARIHAECYERLKATPSAQFLGALARQDLFKEVARAHFLLYPSIFPEVSPVRGDTQIETLEWGKCPIASLVGKKGFHVYSVDRDGALSYSQVRGVFRTRRNARMLRLVAKPGKGRNAKKTKVLYLTPDHEVMLYDGSYKAAGLLKVGDRVKAFHRHKNGWQKGYDEIGVTGQAVVPEHQFVFAKAAGVSVSELNGVVDHKDGNTHNNSPDNLQIWPTHSQHITDHWRRMSPAERDEARQTRRLGAQRFLANTPPEVVSEIKRKAGKAFWQRCTEEEREAYLQRRYDKTFTDTHLQDLSEHMQARMDAKYGSAPWRDGKLLFDLYIEQRLSTTAIATRFGCSDPTIGVWLKKHGIPVRSQSEAHLGNHTIVDISDAANADAYCMEVEPDHNFVANGIVVHNCLAVLEAQALGTPALTTSRGALAESNLTPEHRLFDDLDVEAGRYSDDDFNYWAFSWVKEYLHTYDHPHRVRARQEVQEQILGHYSWEKIALEWEEDLYAHFRERALGHKQRVVENLLYHSDILAARYALTTLLSPTQARPSKPTDLEAPLWHGLSERVEGYVSAHHQDPDLYSGHEGAGLASLRVCPERMEVALDLIADAYGTGEPFTLLDIGCGSGRFLYHALKRFPNCQVIGLDFSEALCIQATNNLCQAFPNLAGSPCIFQGDFLRLPLAEFFEGVPRPDVVFCGEWLEHQTELIQALTQVHDACSVGGMVIYTTPYGPWEAISFGDATTEAGEDIRFHVSHLEHRDFEEMLAGLEYRLDATSVQHSPVDVSILGNFVVSYRKPAHAVDFHLPNYARKFVTTRPYVRLAGLMITKDEEDNITRALKPLVRRLDRMLVYDTGSRDKTAELAERYAHMVVRGYWDDSFAAARNRALACIRDFPEFDADWVYWQDADEVLQEPYKLRWYLQGDLGLYEGFIVTQNHLMLDNPMTVDIPIRLFRNRSRYAFIGRIHEHVLDTTDADGNTNLFPLMILPDVKLAHFGYLSEAQRRDKAQHRNWAILKEDLEENPRRELTQIFLMRDYVQHVRWRLERSPQLTPEHVHLLHEVIRLYQPFSYATHQNHVLARVFYQDALRLLGEHRLPGPSGKVPIHAQLLLAAKRGPLPTEDPLAPEARWFADSVELARYMERQVEHAARFVDKHVRVFSD